MHVVLQRFLFNEAPVRGALIRLDHAWREILSHHTYPPRLRNLLGELLAAGALLAANLKFDGTLIMQMQGSGGLKLAVVEINADHTLRATARWDGELDEHASVEAFWVRGSLSSPWTRAMAASPTRALWRWKATAWRPCWSTTCCARNSWTPG